MANLLPTKGNLIAAKRSRMLAQTGYELMDRKRNILIRELMGMMDTAKELQGQIDAVFTEAYTALQAANIRLGICDRIAEAVDVDDSLTLRYRSVMGVELPRIPGQSPPPRPEYGMGDTCSELDECYLKFYRVKELTRRLAGNPSLSVDEAVYQGFLHYKRLRQPEYFATWMTRILINACNAELRRRKRELAVAELPETAAEAFDALPLREAVARLPRELRAVVVLRYFQGLTLAETAQALDIPLGTVSTRQRKALSLLKLHLTEEV